MNRRVKMSNEERGGRNGLSRKWIGKMPYMFLIKFYCPYT